MFEHAVLRLDGPPHLDFEFLIAACGSKLIVIHLFDFLGSCRVFFSKHFVVLLQYRTYGWKEHNHLANVSHVAWLISVEESTVFSSQLGDLIARLLFVVLSIVIEDEPVLLFVGSKLSKGRIFASTSILLHRYQVVCCLVKRPFLTKENKQFVS